MVSSLELSHMTAEEVVMKFRNAAEALTQDKVNRVVDSVLKLEQMKDISELINQVTL